VVAALVLVAAVQAALPPRGAEFSFADHATAGKDWHVDFTIDAKHRDKIRTLIVYSEQCDATVVKRDVPISPAGVVAAGGGVDGGGTWKVDATFQETRKIVGTMQMIRDGCDTGVLSYPTAITGDGTGPHDHGAKYADFASSTLAERRQARRMQARVLKLWHGATLADVTRLGYHTNRSHPPMATALMFHVYNTRYEKDKRIFDPKRPESFVIWRANGKSVVLGPMFRVPPGKRPRFAGPIPIYHFHPSASGKIVSLMTHVWMVKPNHKIAYANCLPVTQLELYNPAFRWVPGQPPQEHLEPC
jgi:hypothetical protein